MSLDITLTIIDREGVKHSIEAPTDMGMNIMEVIRSYELVPEGTIGVCGGMAMCASCQCYISNEELLNEKNLDEDMMLSEAFYVKDNSRLSCQIPVTSELEGLQLEIAPQ
ncbi:2Fe-2S iron-sulfur cluster-binding protein [Pseudofulvibacter geojedonensis]|uniref:2Fe-2S iron-sulfur cluster-binding protein n=1 Tax=Pseudofulvibacter geojedonensis TaxID=1123758 RepID=A0ABW3HZX9_9FLAO